MVLPHKAMYYPASGLECPAPTPLEFLLKGIQEYSKTIQASAVSLGFLPGLEGKTLLWKTLHALQTQDLEKEN